MFNSTLFARKVWLLVVIIAAATAAVHGDDESKDGTAVFKEVKLPKDTDVKPQSFWVSPDHRFILYGIRINNGTIRGLAKTEVFIIDTQKGKTSKLSELMPKKFKDTFFGTAQMSPKVNKLLFNFIQTQAMPQSPTMLLDLEKGTCSEFRIKGQKVAGACWAGNKIVCSAFKGDRIGEIMFYDSGKTTKGIGVFGKPISASDNGEALLIAGIPDALNDAPVLKDLDKATPLLIDAKGKLIGKVEQAAKMSQQPVFSPDGKFMAFRCGQGRSYYVNVLSTDLKTTLKIDGTNLVLGVTDEGEILTRQTIYRKTNGYPIKLWDKECKKFTELVKIAGPSMLVGDMIFYVEPGEEPVVKAVKLKKPAKD